MKKMTLFFFLSFFFVFFISCKSDKNKVEGFAVFQKVPKPYLFRAISPEGVIIQVQKIQNYPKTADENFWASAIRKYVPQKGYQLIEEGKKDKKWYFVFLVPGSKYDYFYYLCFYLENKEKILLIEAGGQYGFLKQYREKILDFVYLD